MDYACPHCHELLTTDPVSGRPPAMCTRCGGNSQPSTSAAVPTAASAMSPPPTTRSFATFLRGKKTEAEPSVQADSGGDIASSAPAVDALNASAAVLGTESHFSEQHDSLEQIDAPGEEPPGRVSRPAADAATLADAIETEREGANEDRVPDPVARGMEAATLTGDQAAPVEAYADAQTMPVSVSIPPHEEAATPSFTLASHASAVAPRTAFFQWAALVILALALVLQVLLADRARLAANAQWRPLLGSLCATFGCSLPTWRDPDAFTMLSRDVRPMPNASRALLVQATFRNDARWSQDWPVMRLSLSDADGRVVAARAFSPSEYLEAVPTQTTLAPGQSAQVMLQLREPEGSVVAFSFDFD